MIYCPVGENPLSLFRDPAPGWIPFPEPSRPVQSAFQCYYNGRKNDRQ